MRIRSLLCWLWLVTACDFGGTTKLGRGDCRPHKLTRIDECKGQNMGFQGCRLYFRASGVPDRAWCEGLARSAKMTSDSYPECDFDHPSAWVRVPCSSYHFSTNLSCYACSIAKQEADRTYVYAYDSLCGHGIEQVTCNFDPMQVGVELEK